jgi:hypothetical protein
MIKTLLATGALLLAAGCGGETADPATTPTPTPPPVDGGAFDTPADVITKAGTTLPCSDAKADTPTGAKAQTACDDGEVVVRVYVNHSGIDDQVDLLGFAGGAWLLTGENWSVNAPKATLEAANAKLGGQLTHVKCQANC